MRKNFKIENLFRVVHSVGVISLIPTYALSQLLVAGLALIRIPLVTKDTNTVDVGYWLFWASFMTWAIVFRSAPVNAIRLESSRNFGSIARYLPRRSARYLNLSIISISLIAGTLLCNVHATGGFLPTSLTVLMIANGSRYLAYHQALGKMSQQMVASGVGALVGLALTWILTQSSAWDSFTSYWKIFSLTSISGLVFLSPTIWAIISVLHTPRSAFPITSRVSIKDFLSDTSATLPPAFISGLDSVSLAATGHADALVLYGLISRLTIIVSMTTSALFVQVSNHFAKFHNFSKSHVTRLALLLVLLNVPFVIFFIYIESIVLRYLSHGNLIADTSSIVAVGTLGIIFPIWTALSSATISSHESRRSLGLNIFHFVLPMSIGSTFLFAYLFGTSGPFWASNATYLLALFIAWRLLEGPVTKTHSLQP